MNDVHRIDRLADKHVEAGGACLAHAKSFMEERDRNGWRSATLTGAPGAEPANELEPILIRQDEVADHDVRNHRLDHLFGLGGHIVINHQRGNAG